MPESNQRQPDIYLKYIYSQVLYVVAASQPTITARHADDARTMAEPPLGGEGGGGGVSLFIK